MGKKSRDLLTPPSQPDAQTTCLSDPGSFRDALTQRLDRLWAQSLPSGQLPGSPIGQSVSHYRIRAFLGSGAFGVVYLADDDRTNQPVALKFPRAEILVDSEKRRRFAVEATLAATLKHPGIVPIIEADLLGPNPFIVTQWCDGPDLGAWLADSLQCECELPPWNEVAETVARIAEAVDFAHQHDVIHRDLKPANILLSRLLVADRDDRSLINFIPMITDFGLAKSAAASVQETRSSLTVGSPVYMAPEQIDSRFHSEPSNTAKQADIYSLGVILFELLTGRTPFGGESHFELIDNIRHQPTAKLSKLRPGLPKGLQKICSTCLHKNPLARYETPQDLADDLRRCVSGKVPRGKKLSASRCFCYWCTRPQRTKTAGTFAIVFNLIMASWLVMGIVCIGAFDIVTISQWTTVIWQGLMLTFLFHLPLVFLGWKTVQGKRWAPWLAWLLTASVIPPVVMALLSEPVLFRELYANNHPYFSFMTHSMLLICFSVQGLLFSCAAAAGFRRSSLFPIRQIADKSRSADV